MSKTFDRPLLFSHEHRTLGAGMNILQANLQQDEDYVVIPPPPPGVVRWVDVVEGAGAIIYEDGEGSLEALTLIQKDGVLYQFGNLSGLGVGDGAALPFPNERPWVLLPEDEGIILRVTQGPLVGATAFGRWYDVRGVERQTTVLRTGQKVSIVPEAEDNEALKIACDQQGRQSIFVMNRDSVDHVVKVYASDGVREIPLPLYGITPSLSASITAGYVVPLMTQNVPWGSFAEGWSLRAELQTAVVTKAPEVIANFVRTNASPVKTIQGGAF